MIRRFITLVVIGLLVGIPTATQSYAQAPETTSPAAPASGPCPNVVGSSTYHARCDVNGDGTINIVDIQVAASRWNTIGTFLSPNDHNHLAQGWSGNDYPLIINGSFSASAPMMLSNSAVNGDGVNISISSDDGISIGLEGSGAISEIPAGKDGIFISNAGESGIHVRRVGVPSATTASTQKSGFAIDGAQGNGLALRHSDNDGIYLKKTVGDGVYVGTAGEDGMAVGGMGIPSSSVADPNSNGFEVPGSQGDGLFIGRADSDGIHIEHAGQRGFEISSAGIYSGTDYPSAALVARADADGVWVVSSADWAAFFENSIFVSGNCNNCLLASFGRNVSDAPLEPGDVVTVRGATPTGLLNTPLVLEVARAEPGEAIVGVVAGRATLDREQSVTEGVTHTTEKLVPREGAAAPGDYLKIITAGMAQVKVSDTAGTIQQGMALTAASEPGMARALTTQTVDGLTLPEGAPVLGMAMESLEAKQGLIWVLVNPR